MGVTGADIQLSQAAKHFIEYGIECKNQEISKNIYDWYEQAVAHGSGEPLLIVKKNHKKPLAIVDAEHFIKVVSLVSRQ